MRLIDADALKQTVGSYNPVKYTYEYGYVITVEDIDHAPTADVVERKHGEWKNREITTLDDTFFHYVCSCCGAWFPEWLSEASFCPNCGADMRGGTDG